MDFSDCKCIGDVRLKQYLLQETYIFPENELLYHYTSPQGLLGILKNEGLELRFSRSNCLNDITEGNSIIDFYKKICVQLLNESRIDEDFYSSIIEISFPKELFFVYDAEPLQLINGVPLKDFGMFEYVTYVFCFSTLSDSLPLWNYYLKNGQYEGYNLGFSTLELKKKFHYNPPLDFYREFIVVEYDDEEKSDILKDYIEALYRFCENDDTQLSEAKLAISQELYKWRYSFKPSCFSHEKEVRLAIHLPINKDKTALAPFIKNQIRFDDYGIPKYIFATIADKVALSKITISPMFIKTGKKLLSSDFNKKKGYTVEIYHSKIPIRH